MARIVRSYRRKLEPSSLAVKADDEPDFLPDEDMGEGEASEDELDYRAELLLLLAGIAPALTKIVKSDDSISDKEKAISDILSDFQSDAEELIDERIGAAFNGAVENANQTLQDLEKGIKKVKGDKNQLSAIENQQKANIKDIASTLEGKLMMGLNMDEVNTIYAGKPDFSYIETALLQAQTRLDGMGMYGYLQGNMQGGLTALTAGTVLLGEMIVADWVTVGDENVCEDCLELEAGSPYPVIDWPEDPHFGCRCDRENERLDI